MTVSVTERASVTERTNVTERASVTERTYSNVADCRWRLYLAVHCRCDIHLTVDRSEPLPVSVFN